jgi:hypothetical protein
MVICAGMKKYLLMMLALVASQAAFSEERVFTQYRCAGGTVFSLTEFDQTRLDVAMELASGTLFLKSRSENAKTYAGTVSTLAHDSVSTTLTIALAEGGAPGATTIEFLGQTFKDCLRVTRQ